MKKVPIPLAIVVVVIAGWLVLRSERTTNEPDQQTFVAGTLFSCDEGRTISAAFYEGATAKTPPAGEPPVPTGSVSVSLDWAASTTLMQTLSADGARYANPDESFVFWNKGNTAVIMRNNGIDLNYRNCVAKN